jgi:hypothetical protein
MKKIYYTVNRTENETDIVCKVSAPNYPTVTFTYNKENFLENQLIYEITKHARIWAINEGYDKDIEAQIFDNTLDGGYIEIRNSKLQSANHNLIPFSYGHTRIKSNESGEL